MDKYVLIEWPDIQFFMDEPGYPEEVYFDSQKSVWFVPEKWLKNEKV